MYITEKLICQGLRPDIVIKDKTKSECKFIDFACPFDGRIEERQKGLR